MTADLAAWAATQAGRFRRHEHADVYHGRMPRDEALIRWVLDTLAEAGCPATALVLEHIDQRRAGMRETA